MMKKHDHTESKNFSYKEAFFDIFNVNNTYYVLLTIGFAMGNLLLLKDFSGVGFWLGAFFGTIFFLKIRKIPKPNGIIYVLNTITICLFLHYNGDIAMISRLINSL